MTSALALVGNVTWRPAVGHFKFEFWTNGHSENAEWPLRKHHSQPPMHPRRCGRPRPTHKNNGYHGRRAPNPPLALLRPHEHGPATTGPGGGRWARMGPRVIIGGARAHVADLKEPRRRKMG